jgi:hypothetical protein
LKSSTPLVTKTDIDRALNDATYDSAAKADISCPAKTNVSTPAKADISAPTKTNVGAPTKADIGAPAKTNVSTPAKADISAPAKTAPTKADIGAPNKTNVSSPAKADISSPAKTIVGTPAKTNIDADDFAQAFQYHNPSTATTLHTSSSTRTTWKYLPVRTSSRHHHRHFPTQREPGLPRAGSFDHLDFYIYNPICVRSHISSLPPLLLTFSQNNLTRWRVIYYYHSRDHYHRSIHCT